jgi:hypothetical protein
VTTETDRLREQYAMAYNETIPSSESASKRPGESDAGYTNEWCGLYAPEMTKIVRFAEKALDQLRQGRSAADTRALINHEIFSDDGTMVVRLLLGSIPTLRSTLLTDEMDDKSYRDALQLIVDSFSPATA